MDIFEQLQHTAYKLHLFGALLCPKCENIGKSKIKITYWKVKVISNPIKLVTYID